MRPSFRLLTAAWFFTLMSVSVLPRAQVISPGDAAHLDSAYGAYRDASVPRGDCRQCHLAHAEAAPNAGNLFAANNNYLCFSPDGIGGCHATQPTGGSSGYPAGALDRIPLSLYWQGYFEANNAGVERHGVLEQVRWPGQLIWENPNASPHAYDPDMPIQDDMARGACKNCHNVHEGVAQYDLLIDSAGPLAATITSRPPTALALCFSCHSTSGPPGMNPEGRLILDFYDDINRSRNSSPGHAFENSYGAVQAGSKLPCYNCHNPHGSQGGNGIQPNAYLISDERPQWYGLTDTKNSAEQARRFCNGCHPFSDGLGGGLVEGIALEPINPDRPEHRSTGTEHCYDCHGRDYSAPNGRNVHNPGRGLQIGPD
jgi:hypothetical protein